MKTEDARLLVTFHAEQANYQRVGQTVLILASGEYQNTHGKVYRFLPGRMHPWHVRPLAWHETVPGIAFAENEITFDEARVTVRAHCEACGVLFEPEYGYHEPGEYSYCAGCCHW